MFKNHHFEVKFKKDEKQQSNEEVKTPIINPEEIKEIATDLGKKIVIGTITVMAAAAVLGTTSKIVVHKATTNKEN